MQRTPRCCIRRKTAPPARGARRERAPTASSWRSSWPTLVEPYPAAAHLNGCCYSTSLVSTCKLYLPGLRKSMGEAPVENHEGNAQREDHTGDEHAGLADPRRRGRTRGRSVERALDHGVPGGVQDDRGPHAARAQAEDPDDERHTDHADDEDRGRERRVGAGCVLPAPDGREGAPGPDEATDQQRVRDAGVDEPRAHVAAPADLFAAGEEDADGGAGSERQAEVGEEASVRRARVRHEP